MNNPNALQNAATVTVALDLCVAVLKKAAGDTLDGNFIKNHEKKMAVQAQAILDKKEVIGNDR